MLLWLSFFNHYLGGATDPNNKTLDVLYYDGLYVKQLIGTQEAVIEEDYAFVIDVYEYFGTSNHQISNILLNMTTSTGRQLPVGFHMSQRSNDSYLFWVNGGNLTRLGELHQFILIASDLSSKQAAQLFTFTTVTPSPMPLDVSKQIRQIIIFVASYLGGVTCFLLIIYCRDRKNDRLHKEKANGDIAFLREQISVHKKESNKNKQEVDEEATSRSTDPSIDE